ncbi:MAG: hypothetical protein F6K28_12930 [Microcoleus sp. SIO2G3]|nr:hypothetical protein [Microcoleus sp. SIO2G3]
MPWANAKVFTGFEGNGCLSYNRTIPTTVTNYLRKFVFLVGINVRLATDRYIDPPFLATALAIEKG